MKSASAFTSKTEKSNVRNEGRYYITFGLILCLCGILLLMLPIVKGKSILAFLSSWLLFIAALLALIRPITYNRGFADFVMGIMTGFLYGFIGWCAGAADLSGIEDFRVAICAVLIFTGISRILVFARMLSVTPLPLLMVCGTADIIAAILMLTGLPGTAAATIYWFTGMLILIDGAETMTETAKLKDAVSDHSVKAS